MNESYLNTSTLVFKLLDNLTATLEDDKYTILEATLIGLACGIVIILSLVGNTLVVSVVLKYKRLQNATNFILVSLAIADLTVSIFVMIPSMITDVKREWIFNRVFCKFYNSFDIFCCTASILHLLLVAVDRYVAIFKPLSYRTMVRKLHVFGMVMFVWFLSGIISFIPIFLEWNLIGHDSYDENSNSINTTLISNQTNTKELCALEANIPYAIVSSSLSFYIPFIIMIIVYVQIYIVARKQANAIAEIDLQARRHSESTLVNLNRFNNSSENTIELAKKKPKKPRQRRTKDTKAIRTLGIIMGRLILIYLSIFFKINLSFKGIFIICWLPFFIMYIFGSLGYPVRYEIERLITWIGYVNSFINPIVYALTNRDFRKAYVSFLGPIRHLICSCGQKNDYLGNSLASHRTNSRPSANSFNEQNCLCCKSCCKQEDNSIPIQKLHQQIHKNQPESNGVKFYCQVNELELIPLNHHENDSKIINDIHINNSNYDNSI